MRDWFITDRVSIPIPTEPEMYILGAVIIMLWMWIVIWS